jgi:lipopolysaccharide biosynthesis regulator YciM
VRYIIYTILLILLIILCIYIAWLNPLVVEVTLPWLGSFMDVPLIVVILCSVLFGVLISFGIMLIKETRRSIHHIIAARRIKRNEYINQQYNQGMQLVASGHSEEAAVCFNKLLSKYPQHVESNIALGDVYFSADEWDLAAHYHSRALELKDNDPGLMLKLAQDYQQAGKIDGVIDMLQKVIQVDEDNLIARTRLRELYCKQGHWDKAYEMQQQVIDHISAKTRKIQEQQTLWGLKCELAGNQAAHGQHQEAIKALKEIIKADKGFIPAYIQLIDIYQKQGKLEEAYQVIEKGYRQNFSIILLKRMEILSLKHEHPQRIIAAYRQAIKDRPQDYDLYLFLGMLYLKLEMLDEAEEQFQYLTRLKDFSLLHYELAEVLKRKKQYEQSVEEYQRAFKTQEEELQRYTCDGCGAKFPRWEGRCYHCGRWNTINWQI